MYNYYLSEYVLNSFFWSLCLSSILASEVCRKSCQALGWSFLSYRNQSIDLLSKSMDWFLYDRKLHLRTTEFWIHLWAFVIFTGTRRSLAGNYLLKVNSKNTRTKCEICSKLSVKKPERRQWRRSDVFVVNFEHISHLALVFLMLTLKI